MHHLKLTIIMVLFFACVTMVDNVGGLIGGLIAGGSIFLQNCPESRSLYILFLLLLLVNIVIVIVGYYFNLIFVIVFYFV